MDLGLDVAERNGLAVLAVQGEVDVYTAPQLREQLIQLVDAGTAGNIVVNLEGVEFLDSTGPRRARRRAEAGPEPRRRPGLVCTQRRILKVLEITGPDQGVHHPRHGRRRRRGTGSELRPLEPRSSSWRSRPGPEFVGIARMAVAALAGSVPDSPTSGSTTCASWSRRRAPAPSRPSPTPPPPAASRVRLRCQRRSRPPGGRPSPARRAPSLRGGVPRGRGRLRVPHLAHLGAGRRGRSVGGRRRQRAAARHDGAGRRTTTWADRRARPAPQAIAVRPSARGRGSRSGAAGRRRRDSSHPSRRRAATISLAGQQPAPAAPTSRRVEAGGQAGQVGEQRRRGSARPRSPR